MKRIRRKAKQWLYMAGMLFREPRVYFLCRSTMREYRRIGKEIRKQVKAGLYPPVAEGDSLDALGAQFGIMRAPGEPDADYRKRIRRRFDAVREGEA